MASRKYHYEVKGQIYLGIDTNYITSFFFF